MPFNVPLILGTPYDILPVPRDLISSPSSTKAETKEPKTHILWVGCSDSSVLETDCLDVDRAEMFVHRNLGHVLSNQEDLASRSAVEWCVELLKVDHIVICGHYDCSLIAGHENEVVNAWYRDVSKLHTQNHAHLSSKSIDLDERARHRKFEERRDPPTRDQEGRRCTPLPGTPPATISDAMKVVRALGYCYLWVDSLCITQGDPVETKLQIVKMAPIYSNSQPGDNQRVTRVQGDIVLGTLLPGFDQMVMDTKWGSRVLTYQEFMLSRRILIFTEIKTLYHCATLTYRESRVEYWSERQIFWRGDWVRNLESSNEYKIYVILAQNCDNNHQQRDLYEICIAHYTTRQMSYDTDSLNAFKGLLKVMQQQFETRTTFGLLNRQLLKSLAWRPSKTLRRRTETFTTVEGVTYEKPLFPSWTWAAWEGAVIYDSPSYHGINPMCLVFEPLPIPLPAIQPLAHRFSSQVLLQKSEEERELMGMLPIVAKCATFDFTSTQKTNFPVFFTLSRCSDARFRDDISDEEALHLSARETFILLYKHWRKYRVMLIDLFEYPLLFPAQVSISSL
ncbi:hypothetical protein G7Y89_g9750 [Cudoniella acicularis]|uniref:Heterokaryon incompatibility domain-containing protein n=1 Tax=Cudoniella acicularis TaxID=354080 RepID=A0A8H4RHR7_9HELO|nr:hypothetical protein G7Y89_g9750 [Cudoniella acicularis]